MRTFSLVEIILQHYFSVNIFLHNRVFYYFLISFFVESEQRSNLSYVRSPLRARLMISFFKNKANVFTRLVKGIIYTTFFNRVRQVPCTGKKRTLPIFWQRSLCSFYSFCFQYVLLIRHDSLFTSVWFSVIVSSSCCGLSDSICSIRLVAASSPIFLHGCRTDVIFM